MGWGARGWSGARAADDLKGAAGRAAGGRGARLLVLLPGKGARLFSGIVDGVTGDVASAAGKSAVSFSALVLTLGESFTCVLFHLQSPSSVSEY